jgi:Protein of unknown function (DUF1194)
MKATITSAHGLRYRSPFTRAMSMGIAAVGLLSPVEAVNVDSEMILLVDATQAGLSTNQFNNLMDGYATAFTSSQMLDSIATGAYGRIAVSLMFFGNSSSQEVGIAWTSISNSTEALAFATQLQNVLRPTYTGASSVASALTTAAFTFGTETGAAANGFESEVQIIEVLASRVPNSNTAAATTAASNIVRAAGVDMINSIAVGGQAATIEAFYSANVVGSTIAGSPATSGTSSTNAAVLAGNLTTMINGTVQTGAATSVTTAVPEPGSISILAAGSLLLLKRRRR